MEKLAGWLAAHLPASADAAIVHGDYRVGNTIIHAHEPRLAAVLDWELATIGDPLADLAYLAMAYEMPPGGPGVAGGLEGADLRSLGVPSEAELLSAYAGAASRAEIPHWSFYKALAFFRIAAIVQGRLCAWPGRQRGGPHGRRAGRARAHDGRDRLADRLAGEEIK